MSATITAPAPVTAKPVKALSRLAVPSMFLINGPYTILLGFAAIGHSEAAGYWALVFCLLGTVASGIIASKHGYKTRANFTFMEFVSGAENALVAAAAFGHLDIAFSVLFWTHVITTGSGIFLFLFAKALGRLTPLIERNFGPKAQVHAMARKMRKQGLIPADTELPARSRRHD